MTTNPIAIGLDWRQAFDFPEGFFQPSDQVRAKFRQYASDRLPLATTVTPIEGARLFIELDEAQTRAMARLCERLGRHELRDRPRR